jgi:hypothetical protein
MALYTPWATIPGVVLAGLHVAWKGVTSACTQLWGACSMAKAGQITMAAAMLVAMPQVLPIVTKAFAQMLFQ